LLDVGTTVHDPPAALREHILIRDGGCTQPICSNPRVDLDHNTRFPHGPTSAANLRSRCRHHHHLKQHPQWQAQVGEDGRIQWITPVYGSLARSAHRPVRSSGRGRPCDAPGLSAAGHTYPEHIPDLRPGATSTPRPDPHIGPDPPRDDPTRDNPDPPPF
ncbi:MAG: hypothetical protein M3492_08455, partial [Actinomycetota bacterium]|nr:hypothetical protein [Actinomycetota bacterium]